MISETKPVWSAATIIGLIAAVIGLLVAFGVPITDDMKVGILAVASILAPFAVPYLSASRTTALADPHDTDGTPLVRADTGGQTRAAAKRTEKADVQMRERPPL